MADGAHSNVPRHDLDAEAATLCSALLTEDAALELIDLLDPDDYYANANRRVFEAIRALARDNRKIDVVSVAGELRVSGRLEEIGGTVYLAQLADATPAVAHLAEHARIVRDLARLRRLGTAFRQVLGESTTVPVGDIGSFLEDCESRAYLATADRRNRAESQSYDELVRETYQVIYEASQRPEEIPKNERRTGFYDLDEHIGGMCGGDLIVVAARPGQGKSALAQQIAEYVASQSWAVAYLSLEMKKRQLMLRSLARRSGTTALQLRRGRSEDWGSVLRAVEDVRKLPMRVDDQSDITPMRARAKVRRMYSEIRSAHPGLELGLVVVDYLQLMGFDEGVGNKDDVRAVKIGHVTRAWKLFAMEFDVPVMLLSQLNRPKKDSGKVPRPSLTDLRDSGRIEEDADTVLFVHREDQYRDLAREKPTGEAEIIVAKVRGGDGEGIHRLLFNGPRTQFSNLNGEPPRQQKMFG